MQCSNTPDVSLFSPTFFALHCTALYCTALHCTVLHCTALHFTALHFTALCYTSLHCTSLHCATLQCTIHFLSLHCSPLEYVTKIYGASLHCSELLRTAQTKYAKICVIVWCTCQPPIMTCSSMPATLVIFACQPLEMPCMPTPRNALHANLLHCIGYISPSQYAKPQHLPQPPERTATYLKSGASSAISG